MELKIPVEIEIPELAALQQAVAGVTNKLADLEARIIELELGAEPPPPPPPPPPDPDPEPPPVAGPGTRLVYQGQEFFAAGVNVPWTKYKECIGGNNAAHHLSRLILAPDGSLNRDHAIVKRFEMAVNAGARLFTFWLFPADTKPSQIIEENGVPVGVKPQAIADIRALVKMAEELDFYLILPVFNRPERVKPWLINQMGSLVEVMRWLFAEFAGEKRIMAWQPFVEPGWDIWSDKITPEPVQEFVNLFAQAVHETTTCGQMATINCAMLDELPYWVGLGLDFYQSSWYDYMNNQGAWHEGNGGQWCALCRDYADVAAAYDLDGPLMIGELFAGPTATYNVTGVTGGPRERLEAFYQKGYAGVMPWPLFPDQTTDTMDVDWGAFAAFAAAHDDVGPA
jgi:hypothetical protein